MRSWHRNLRDIGWSLGATRNEELGPNSICSAPNLRRAPTRPEAPITLEARKRFSDQRDRRIKAPFEDARQHPWATDLRTGRNARESTRAQPGASLHGKHPRPGQRTERDVATGERLELMFGRPQGDAGL